MKLPPCKAYLKFNQKADSYYNDNTVTLFVLYVPLLGLKACSTQQLPLVNLAYLFKAPFVDSLYCYLLPDF